MSPRRAAWHPVPRPFVKWVGGKRQLLPELLKKVPRKHATYHEPFVGGGALFFAVQPGKAVLSDGNDRLVRAYCGVRDDLDKVLELLVAHQRRHDKEFFLEMRRRPIDDGTDAEIAAWLIYLNKTGYNGLYRVNKRNIFNVPPGSYRNPNICDERNLRACSAALRNVELFNEGFETVADRAAEDDFVYFDPPYVPLSRTSNFTSYTRDGFGPDDQERLRDVALGLKRRGVAVLLSNSDTPEVRSLYQGDFRTRRVQVARAINSKGSGRGKIKELLIW